jgi:polyhydroxybutyrate depolymerase
MRPRSFSFAVIILSLAAAAFTQTLSFNVAGVSRTYVLHVPTGTLGNPPLVFMLHGHGMDATSQESGSKWFPIADREKFIVAYPNAISQNWDVSATSNDLVFMLAIIDSIDAKYHIDRNRVYVAGFSQGAAMCHMCGCAHSEVFAAMAPASGGLSGNCALKRPVPLFMTFGTKDMSPTATFMTSVVKWVQLDSCPAVPVVTRPYPASNPQSVVTRLTYGPGKNGALVIADSILGGPHEWPMDTKIKVNNSEEAWAFFKMFSLKGNTAVHQHAPAVPRDGLSVSYSAGVIRLQGADGKCPVRVFDTRGRLVATAAAARGQVDLGDKTGGVYVVVVNGKNGPVPVRIMLP